MFLRRATLGANIADGMEKSRAQVIDEEPNIIEITPNIRSGNMSESSVVGY